MLKDYLKWSWLFLRSSNFYRGLLLTVAVLIPLIGFNIAGQLAFGISIAMGVFLNAPSNTPGTFKIKTITTLLSIGLTMLVTLVMNYAKVHFIVLIAALLMVSFFVSLIAAYGFRGSLIAFSGLLAMTLALARDISDFGIWLHVCLIGVGGLWFLVMSWAFQWLSPKKDEDQLLSETLYLTGSYLKIRGKLLTKRTNRGKLLGKILNLQTQLSEKHEVLRELLLSERQKVGRSGFDEKRLLILITLVDILELALANTLNYNKIDDLFGDQHHLLPFRNLNVTMGNHLQVLSEILVRKKKVQNKDELLAAVDQAQIAIREYLQEVPLPEGREGAIILRNLLDYQEQQIEKVRSIRRVMANVEDANKITLKKKDAKQFITTQEYSLNILLQNLSIDSPICRHALRLTIAVGVGFLLGTLLGIRNPYWIVLTLIVLMRPSFGLTKERAKERIIGTLIGAAVAVIIILITDNTLVYQILAVISLTLAFSLIVQSYRSAAAFITLFIIFVYALINPNSFQVVQYRILDTAIGAVLAVIANYTLWPTWEFMNIDGFIQAMIKKNKAYLLAIKQLYHSKNITSLEYKIPRKEAFLAVSNLNAAFQRMTQDPKSKQKEMGLIYDLVTLNNTFLSALASLGSFIQNHKTTAPSPYFDAFIANIQNNLEETEALLDKSKSPVFLEHLDMETAKQELKKSYDALVTERNEQIHAGKTDIGQDMRVLLQEAHLISNQLIWLKSLSEDIKKNTAKYETVFSG
ncbi:FUSC family protein [Sediminicola sp. 1XM1-17]|uniref:FUSC family protein n=1 Tax=Sediminicola sp. 1XM1-17 TaxID=3127702 RepID=UPI00307883A5